MRRYLAAAAANLVWLVSLLVIIPSIPSTPEVQLRPGRVVAFACTLCAIWCFIENRMGRLSIFELTIRVVLYAAFISLLYYSISAHIALARRYPG